MECENVQTIYYQYMSISLQNLRISKWRTAW